jgi:ankyrin repeat protein
MTSALPDHADLLFEKKQAKGLLKACRAGDPAALARVQAHLSSPRSDPSQLTLADAQFVIARERGFPSWQKLKAHIDAHQPIEQQAERFLRAAWNGQLEIVTRLLTRTPALARYSIYTACAALDAETVANWLTRDAAIPAPPADQQGFSPLMYVCVSRMHTLGPSYANASLRCAQLLLDHGVDPNSYQIGGQDGSRLSALYFACVANNVPVVKLLLQRGADPNDGESTYHAAELNHRECLELLSAHGARISDRHPSWGNTVLFFLASHATDAQGMQWALEHGANPNVTSGDADELPLHQAAARGHIGMIDVLLAHGADPNLPRKDGRASYAFAVRGGNIAVLDKLRAAGAVATGVMLQDELIGACLRGDEATARSLTSAHPHLMETLAPEDRNVFADAAGKGNIEAVRTMAAIGFDVSWEHAGGGTPLHLAAWQGRADVVKLLVQLGAPINQRDSTYGSSPIGWAAHGSTYCRRADESYCAIVDTLVDAGAEYPAAVNRWNQPPQGMASSRVRARLIERGFVPTS